ncbi:CvfB family protein [Alkaliphilus transvaalensis]|uniref:CvfB family protein n=1 Tax=Alkaliphilus transvaalensis TaxID=114628 RepID=UPI00047B38E8|nr:S1-like domain-containing RNA-binding protein [Alkaliphilus transvaalensis]
MSLNIGKINELKVARKTKYGAFLETTGNHKEDVLLPQKEVTDELAVGDLVKVFVYRDSMDRVTATFKKPYGEVGSLAYLKVVDLTGIGAFLDWGLEKDILLPISEQTTRVRKGSSYLVKIYIDKSNRLCCTMNIDEELKVSAPYKTGDLVKGTVYSINPRLGLFVAIDNQYYGLAHTSEVFKTYQVGDQDTFRIIKVREDGKVDLSTKKLAYQQMDDDAEKLLYLLKQYEGFLPINDKSDPKEINKYIPTSKNAFKRALGKLLKEKKVVQDSKGIRLLK